MCPFRNDVDFHFSHERAEQLAIMTTNRYNSFTCHKTADITEDNEYEYGGEFVHGEKSKECHGFLTMQIIENGDICKPKGFKPKYELVYNDWYEMADRYSQED